MDAVYFAIRGAEVRLILYPGLMEDWGLRKICSRYADHVMTSWIIVLTEKRC